METPPFPSFPTNCWKSLLVFFVLVVISILLNKLLEKPDPKDKTKKVYNSKVAIITILSILAFVITLIGCNSWYSMKKRTWIYNHGSSQQKTGQVVSDMFSLLSQKNN